MGQCPTRLCDLPLAVVITKGSDFGYPHQKAGAAIEQGFRWINPETWTKGSTGFNHKLENKGGKRGHKQPEKDSRSHSCPIPRASTLSLRTQCDPAEKEKHWTWVQRLAGWTTALLRFRRPEPSSLAGRSGLWAEVVALKSRTAPLTWSKMLADQLTAAEEKWPTPDRGKHYHLLPLGHVICLQWDQHVGSFASAGSNGISPQLRPLSDQNLIFRASVRGSQLRELHSLVRPFDPSIVLATPVSILDPQSLDTTMFQEPRSGSTTHPRHHLLWAEPKLQTFGFYPDRVQGLSHCHAELTVSQQVAEQLLSTHRACPQPRVKWQSPSSPGGSSLYARSMAQTACHWSWRQPCHSDSSSEQSCLDQTDIHGAPSGGADHPPPSIDVNPGGQLIGHYSAT